MKVGVFGYWEHAPPYFLLGLEGPDERRRQATLAFLARLAQVDPRALLALMHQAFLWLTPQAAEDAAVQLLPGLPVAERPQELAEGLCNLSAAAASYRLQRLFAERVAPQLEPWVRARVIEFVRGRPPSPRRDWLAGLIEASAPG
jgi:hypothetical protein